MKVCKNILGKIWKVEVPMNPPKKGKDKCEHVAIFTETTDLIHIESIPGQESNRPNISCQYNFRLFDWGGCFSIEPGHGMRAWISDDGVVHITKKRNIL